MATQLKCGPTEDDAVCLCGCSGYEDRCAYWVECYNKGIEVHQSHTCCRVFIGVSMRAGEAMRAADISDLATHAEGADSETTPSLLSESCECGVYPPSSCTFCNSKKKFAQPERNEDDPNHGKIVAARYPGQCKECNLPIAVYQTIKNHQGKWYHKSCADQIGKTNC